MNSLFIKSILAGSCLLLAGAVAAQENPVRKDSIQNEKTQTRTDMTANRNVMLNADNDKGPRSLNIGLPASSVGINVIENGLPVSYSLYPVIPVKVWRLDTGILGFNLNTMGTSAIEYGEVGYTAAVIDNFGIPLQKNILSLKSNHYGLLNGSFTTAGEFGNGLTMYSVTVSGNFDPGTIDTDFAKYHSDQTYSVKAALSQAYKFGGTVGRIGVMYRYLRSGGLLGHSLPYIYRADGSVDPYKNLEIGKTSYHERSGLAQVKNPFTGEIEEFKLMDADFRSHNIDLVNNMRFANGWTSNTTIRFMTAIGGGGASMPVSQVSAAPGDYKYMDGTDYTHQDAFMGITIFSHDVPAKYLAFKTDLGKRFGNHKAKVALTNQYYRLEDYLLTTTPFYEELAENPRKIVPAATFRPDGTSFLTDKYGNLSVGYNAMYEYVDGWENKTALVLTDKWNISKRLSVDLGARMELHKLSGSYAPQEARADGMLIRENFKKLDDTYLNLGADVSAVWKAGRNFGFLLNGGILEKSPELSNYSSGEETSLEKSVITNGGIGIYYNNPFFNVISKGTYIKKSNFVSIQTFNAPHDMALTSKQRSVYDIETLGWTTDVISNPFPGFEFHFMFTMQMPRYKNYEGEVSFSDGYRYAFNFEDKTVDGISKYLLEFDPSYTFLKKKVKVWASARYFSKQYANKSNTLTFAPRWETFAGLNVFPVKGLDLGVTFVNLLNQKGASGTIASTDLLNQSQMGNMAIDRVLNGGYMRPFTVEFSAKYMF